MNNDHNAWMNIKKWYKAGWIQHYKITKFLITPSLSNTTLLLPIPTKIECFYYQNHIFDGIRIWLIEGTKLRISYTCFIGWTTIVYILGKIIWGQNYWFSPLDSSNVYHGIDGYDYRDTLVFLNTDTQHRQIVWQIYRHLKSN